MRVLGLGLEDRVHEAKTVRLYREGLAHAGVIETLFKQFDSYLARQGYIARGGQLHRTGATKPQYARGKQGDQGRRDARGLGRSGLSLIGDGGQFACPGPEEPHPPQRQKWQAAERTEQGQQPHQFHRKRAGPACLRRTDQRHGRNAGAHHWPDPRKGQDWDEKPRLQNATADAAAPPEPISGVTRGADVMPRRPRPAIAGRSGAPTMLLNTPASRFPPPSGCQIGPERRKTKKSRSHAKDFAQVFQMIWQKKLIFYNLA